MTTGHFYSVFPTAFGWIALAGAERGIKRLALPEATVEDAICEVLRHGQHAVRDDLAYPGLRQRLQSYFSGKRIDFAREPLDIAGQPPFWTAVREIVKDIPYGETRTYSWVAGKAGSPEAARAVGQAMAANPVPILIPCHRVVAARGIGGYRGGLELKKKLLNLEAGALVPSCLSKRNLILSPCGRGLR